MASADSGNVLSDDDQDLWPQRQRLGGVLRREGNWKCFLLTLMISGCLASVAWCTLAEVDREIIDLSAYPIKRTVRESPCEVGYAYIPIAFVLLLYLVYLVECYHSTARIQLARRVDIASVAERVRAMRDAHPRVWWKAVCYHYVRRKRQVTRYRNGDAYTTTQVYYERVNTHSASTSFAHACCGQRDASRNLRLEAIAGAARAHGDSGARPPITKVRFSKGFAFANIEAASEFEEQRSRFFAEHERFDDFMEMREGLDLVGVSAFKEYMVAYRETENISWYSSQVLFWVLSCLLLSWPLRIVIECNTAYVHYTITKIFGTNYELGSSRHLDLETHLSEHTPPVTASNYGWASPAVLAGQLAVMSTAAASGVSASTSTGSAQQVDILALAARRTDPAILSHATTVDSLELFAAIRENCALVPSYSEAIRIDAEAISESDDSRRGDARHVASRCEVEEQPSVEAGRRLQRTTVKAASFDEPTRRPRVQIVDTHSNFNLVGSASTKELNRRSWAGMISSGRQVVEEIRTYAAGTVAYRPIPDTQQTEGAGEEASRASATPREGSLFYPQPLSQRCAHDPFGGRALTTPTEEPPPYEEALRLPAVRRLTRSATGELAAPAGRRAYLLDTVANRRSCVLSDAHGVRLLHTGPFYETDSTSGATSAVL